MKIGIIGAGRAGINMAKLFIENEHEVAFYDRSSAQLELAKSCAPKARITSVEELIRSSQWLVLSVPDDKIAQVFSSLKLDAATTGVIHLSGALSASVIGELNPSIRVVGIHPIRAFASVYDDVSLFKDTYFGVEASSELFELWKAELPTIKDRMIKISEDDKAVYHAAAVMASNYIVTVLNRSIGLYQSIGFEEDKATEIAVGLAKTALMNVGSRGVRNAQTGPLFRGDVKTIEKHLKALTGKDKEFYLALARATHESYQEQLTDEVKLAIKKLINEE
ncbi:MULTISPECIES: Rossmann-like and DUF2520 domain-containing protein [unclassified Fusibacter]|uniref:Rossmann-like and DUF2520 domain-containing protein n=1 Tax=unclassified Fusibacter TaxID=2624464 RepID=UPI0013E90957|nr:MULTISPECIES: Rossmann-like and DUF2520 domain-containing protein [unclassified Fusibacter]MCK8061030.1 DUF2520 domain-containing protein [Fusibacter sp. A2]NPE20516.1 DUF2520 domain-containing protein [Fusibacter sp. A1]